mmetsp:Transcript_1031/g.2221  ORF Transcript_1031/g.2221 Transcript_1031/m.2221 type:complete len:665 (+) Transcript_1031:155-2149(+)
MASVANRCLNLQKSNSGLRDFEFTRCANVVNVSCANETISTMRVAVDSSVPFAVSVYNEFTPMAAGAYHKCKPYAEAATAVTIDALTKAGDKAKKFVIANELDNFAGSKLCSQQSRNQFSRSNKDKNQGRDETDSRQKQSDERENIDDGINRFSAQRESILDKLGSEELDESVSLTTSHLETSSAARQIAFAENADDLQSSGDSNASIKVWRNQLGDDHPDIVFTLNQIGSARMQNFEYVAAVRYFSESLRIVKKIRPDNHREIAAVLVKLGEVYLLQKDFKMALQYYEEALKIITDVPDAEEADQPEVLIYIGHVYFEEGNTVMAKQYYERAYSIAERFLGERHPFLADILNNIGNLLSKTKEYTEAMEVYSKALRIKRSAFGGGNIDLAETMQNIGNIHSKLGQYDVAVGMYQEVLKLRKLHYGLHDHRVSETFMCIGNVQKLQERYDEALKSFQNAYEIIKMTLGEWHMKNGDILSNIGLIQNKKGDKKKALQTLREALQIYRDYGLSDDHAAVERTLNNISVVKYGERSSMPTLERSARKMAQNNKAGNLEPLLRSVAAAEEQTLAFADAILETSSKIVGTFKTSVIDFKLEDYVNRIQEVKFQLEGGGTSDFFSDNSTAFDTSNVSNTLSLMSSDYMYEGAESYDDSLLSSDFVESKRR